jgi:pimeloyl-ACP methyl ester carboxylesterase
LSDKPETGYGFDEVTADLKALLDTLGLERPVVAGQSWGGNVVLDFAARYPDSLSGLVLVDGGFLELSADPGTTWEKISVDLRPPPLAGTPRIQMLERMEQFHRNWSREQIEMQMGNFEDMPDGTIRPWLSLDRHMAILEALWAHKPSELFGRVQTPTLIAAAGLMPEERRKSREETVIRAEKSLPKVRVHWFMDAPHDIHVDKPDELAGWMLEALDSGFFDQQEK